MTHLLRKFFVLLSLLLLSAATTTAQIAYTGGSYTQNFNTLPSSGTFTFSGFGPFALTAPPINASGLAGWSFAKVNGSGANALFFFGTGSSATGGTYSFGSTASSERALGYLFSGTVGSVMGAVLTNNTGATISQFTVSYTGEQWRYGGTTGTDRIAFEYQVGGASITTGTFTPVTALDFSSPVNGTTGGVTGALNGNALPNTAFVTATVTGLNWTAGQTLVLRWSDFNVAGSDDGLGVDDFTFSTPTPVGGAKPSVITTTPAAGAVGISPVTNLTINFNMPVITAGNWATLTGSASGPHTATITGGPTSYTLTPSPLFAEGETVTVTVLASQITDAATGTKHPDADFTFTFNTLSTTPLPIHTIQGNGPTSSYVGQVQSIQGIVTATFQGTGGLGGFYVQEPESSYDADPATSEGIFVFNNSFIVSVGEVVKVTGTVAEFGPAPRTQTELTSVTFVTSLGTAALPAPVAVTLPFNSFTVAESYEGMRATLPQTLTVTDNFDYGHFGELIFSLGRLSTPTNVVAPGGPAVAQGLANELNRIMVDDGNSATYPSPTPFLADSNGRGLTRRAGSTATGVTGILDEKFGSYLIEPTAPIAFVDANPRTDAPALPGSLRVAIGNVLNLFNGNGSGLAGSAGGFPTSRGADTLVEFQRQRAKIIAGIIALTPDIMGLTEIENDGYGPTSALADLVAGLNAAAPAGTTYAFVDASAVDIVTDQIHCAFIYRVETAAPVGNPAMLNNPYFNSLARNPLAQTFQEIATGEVLTVSINHFKSKGSASTGAAATDGIVPNPNLDQGDGQAASNYLRTRQAQALSAWLATDPTGSGDPDFLIIGDLNAYAKEDPIVALENAGYINLTEAAEGPGGYSYAFGGEFGHLDHALASYHLMAQVTDAATWHVNSDEPVYYDYNVENKNAAQQAVNATGAYRYSDHDPVVVTLDLHPDFAPPVFTLQPSGQTVILGSPVTFVAAASGYPVPTYQWQRNGVNLPGATGASLTINPTTMADAGTYTVIATNSQGIATSNSAVLIVKDVTPPVLSLPASQTLEATGPGGAPATFSGSALDNVDGSVPVIFSPASGTTFVLGTTTVTATATDAAGNVATGSFTVTVADTTAPVLTLPASQTLEATGPAGAGATFIASALDTVSGSRPVSYSQAPGSTFPLGTTTVTVSATDAAGNVATGSFTITVQDTTAPVLTLPANLTLEATSAAGAMATFSASASDLVSGGVPVTLSPVSGSTFALGTTTVNASATDAAGNTATGTFTIKVQDTTAPVFTSLTTSSTSLWPANHKMVAVTLTATATDAASAPVTFKILSAVSNEPDNGLGDGDTVGDIVLTGPMTLNLRAERSGSGTGRIYTITVEARDAAGNTSTKTVTVSVPKSQGK